MNVWAMYKKLPFFIQSALVTLYNVRQYKVRHRGDYSDLFEYYSDVWLMPLPQWHEEQQKRLGNFLAYSVQNSPWYANFEGKSLSEFPVLEKQDLISHLDKIKTVEERDAIASLTGGTTGASMKVLYTKDNIQERFAILDSFRKKHGYSLGDKVAWFSGKNLATENDVLKGKCYRDDYVNNIRFFSTFHINEKNFDSYWRALENQGPDFIVGFPSSVYDICEVAYRKGLRLSKRVNVFFPTAEVVLPKHREVIGDVLGCRLVDQYASSEGAPFILECESGHLHIHPLTGIFEVVDENMKHAREGELLVTSFSTQGTPLIRYRIGDRVSLANPDFQCPCGSSFPVVNKIEGRSSDYVFSPQNGRVNLGNISNSTKDVPGIVCFQIEQRVPDEVTIIMVTLPSYDDAANSKFVQALRDRLGDSMRILIEQVDEIPREKSGKFRIVKNYL